MAGIYTPGMPTAVPPFTGLETVPVDTNLAQGINPETESMSLQQIGIVGLGRAPIVLTDAAIITMDVSKGSYFSVVLGATGRTLTPTNPSPGQVVDLEVVQDSTGSRTITTWTNVTWAAGTPPVLTTTANAIDVVRLTWNATAGKWRGETVGKAFA